MPMASSRRALLALARLALAGLLLLPLGWMLAAALRPVGAPLPTRFGLPAAPPTLANFARAWELVPLGAYTLNSLLLLATAVPAGLLVASLAGYALARLPRPAARRLVLLSLLLLLVPGIALWPARFLVYRQLGWLDTPLALAAPALLGGSPLCVLLFYRAFRRLSPELYDAALLDGAGQLRVYALVALPLARPTAVGVALLCVAQFWGDYLGPALYLRGERWATATVALALLAQLARSDWPLLMAGATIVAAPTVLLLLALHRAIQEP